MSHGRAGVLLPLPCTAAAAGCGSGSPASRACQGKRGDVGVLAAALLSFVGAAALLSVEGRVFSSLDSRDGLPWWGWRWSWWWPESAAPAPGNAAAAELWTFGDNKLSLWARALRGEEPGAAVSTAAARLSLYVTSACSRSLILCLSVKRAGCLSLDGCTEARAAEQDAHHRFCRLLSHNQVRTQCCCPLNAILSRITARLLAYCRS